jgi:hypothetical protein
MKKITLAIDDDVLEAVRKHAALRNTTVNAIVREHLTNIARREDRVRDAVRRIKQAGESSDLEVGDVTWTRDDLHES